MRKLVSLLTVFLVMQTAQCQWANKGPQPGDTVSNLPPGLSARFLRHVRDKTAGLDRQLMRETEKYLREMEGSEVGLKKKVSRMDADAADRIFGDIRERYRQLSARLQASGTAGDGPSLGGYVPSLDSLQNALLFFRQNKDRWAEGSGLANEDLSAALEKARILQGRIGAADQFKSVLDQRRQFLEQKLQSFGMAKQLRGMTKKIYYYKQQLADFRESLKDASVLQQKAMMLLSRLPTYQQFMRQHSFLTSLFGQPERYNLTDSALKGLQTRAAVQEMIKGKMAAGGENAGLQVSQQMSEAVGQLSQLGVSLAKQREKGLPDDPDFRPNTQKTRPFRKRLAFGADVQFQSSNNFLPSMADLAVSLGYRLNDNGTLGLGLSYKAGLGNGIRDVRISGQGAGFRSYLDWKWKKNFYFSGGYESNYLPQLQTIGQLKSLSSWRQSGLIGLSRRYRVSSRVEGKLQLLFDFLSYYQKPRSQPLLFRVGWAF
ncbi:hypothetical protein [Puia dinghuensis]|uniref:Uncharacterized protein n=1 Tax=Puia dinghuensis TaxID=1792502 RepID=A0A8J2XPV4_9BACT|nr:hypothetical protein [Puia dinghuensis]GGA82735.1 hypothetical protein GCM10011511_02190 [Puia dinghuensis]